MRSEFVLGLVEKRTPVVSHGATNAGSQMRDDRVVQAPFLEPTALNRDT